MEDNFVCSGNCASCPKRCWLNQHAPVTRGYVALRDDFTPRTGFGIAIDLGTTTLAMELIDLESGKAIASCGFENPQRSFGPDVISRIAATKDHAAELRQCIYDAIATQASELLQERALTEVVISGNTTMVYLLLGYDCACLGKSPFNPETPLENPFTLEMFDCPVFVVPWISAFVGGDIVSGLLNTPREGSFLLVDLGTNGEIALCHAGQLYATATAAGPAFEGMQPGLYGSDVLNIMARLLREARIDETGYLEEDAYGFTQRDIRQVQLAKSAVRTGIEVLLDLAGRPALETVYLCGGIGQAMNEQAALDIGLFPQDMQGKVVALGNASLGGAARLLRYPEAREEIPAIVRARHVNLSEQAKFNDYFMEYMSFE